MPGYLLPDDICQILMECDVSMNYSSIQNWSIKEQDADTINFITDYFLASDGAIVKKGNEVFRIPTIVPARKETGECIFFADFKYCSIHSVSPFGCAFFDSHQTQKTANVISSLGLKLLALLFDEFGWYSMYYSIWKMLYKNNKIAKPPEICREKMKNANISSLS